MEQKVKCKDCGRFRDTSAAKMRDAGFGHCGGTLTGDPSQDQLAKATYKSAEHQRKCSTFVPAAEPVNP